MFVPLRIFPIFVLPDYHYETDSDGDLVPAAGEKTPAGAAKEVVATLKTLLHFISIQEGRQRWNKESFLAASLDVLNQVGQLHNLSQEERQACEAAKVAVDNRHNTPSPFDAPALFFNAVNAPTPAAEEDE